MDKRKNILIIDLRDVEDDYLMEFLNDLGTDNISWVWLENVPGFKGKCKEKETIKKTLEKQ